MAFFWAYHYQITGSPFYRTWMRERERERERGDIDLGSVGGLKTLIRSDRLDLGRYRSALFPFFLGGLFPSHCFPHLDPFLISEFGSFWRIGDYSGLSTQASNTYTRTHTDTALLLYLLSFRVLTFKFRWVYLFQNCYKAFSVVKKCVY